MQTDKKLGSTFITLETDFERKFAWCIRKVHGIECIVLHERKDGLSCYNENDYITAIPVDRVMEYIGKIK